MATDDLISKLSAKFTDVPKIGSDTLTAWLNESCTYEGYPSPDDVPLSDFERVLLRAQIVGIEYLLINSAHFFNFTDGEESVNKAAISSNYLKILNFLTAKYNQLYNTNSGFKAMKRLDRP